MGNKIYRSLTAKQREELEGFDEIIDLMFEGNLDIRDKKTSKSSEHNINEYELYNFLLEEKNRLQKLDNLLGTIIPNLENNSQTNLLIDEQSIELKNKKEIAAKLIIDENSIFSKNIAQIYNQAFKLKSI